MISPATSNQPAVPITWPRVSARFAAIVHSRDGVRFVATAGAQPLLFERVAQYVVENAEHQLWPCDSIAIADLLRQRQLEAAIDRYFACVGERWDEEWIAYLDSHSS